MISIYEIIQGPIHLDDVPAEDWPDQEQLDDDQQWFLEVMAQDEDDDEPVSCMMWFRELDDAFDIYQHLKKNSAMVIFEDDGTVHYGMSA